MINWAETKTRYGYGSLSELKGIKRPIVLCSCITCNRLKEIKLRIKTDHNYQCPSCVCIKRKEEISNQVTNSWKDQEYRQKQITKKTDPKYKQLQSTLSKQRWSDQSYISQLKTGINKETLSKSTFNIIEASDWRTKMTVQCKECSHIFSITPQNHFDKSYCPKCHISKGQREISEWLTSFDIPHIINDRKTLSGKELDIFIPGYNIAIEYHGLFWHSHNTLESKTEREKHQSKALLCQKLGIKLFQIFENEWQTKNNLLKSMVNNSIGLSLKIDARKTKCKEISNKEAKIFFDSNHLQGHRNSKHIYGLYYKEELISAISFNQHRDGYEIIRLASKQNHSVRGGASKLLSHFLKSFNKPKIFTFADLRHSHGTVYKTLGFQELGITPPGYFYYHPNTNTIISRQKCQKHKLKNMLPNYDATLSESNNMFNNGFRRIWTAGNLKYSLISF